MISVIIASVHRDLLDNVYANIDDTIGLPYEIISIENSDGQKGLCEIYNIGARRAKYNILCFMHEDIAIKTADWGLTVVEAFDKNKELGVLGVAGSSYKAFAPSGWGIGGERNTEAYNYFQRFKDLSKPVIHAYLNAKDLKSQEVVTVDGMWFCTTKEIALEFGFDEVLFTGFHCYDLDYCLNVGTSYQIRVTFEILMEHFSEGGYNKDWFFDTLKLHNKWSDQLPRYSFDIPVKVKSKIERKSYQIILARLVHLGISSSYIIAFLNTYRHQSKMNLWLYLRLRFKLMKLLNN
ncbi:MAG: glycosyltransferase [Bacteroidota bacterium]